MQETRDLDGQIHQEFFTGQTDQEAQEKMGKRLKTLESQGHTLVKRVKIGRNAPCPCGSGKKFKRCHLGHVR